MGQNESSGNSSAAVTTFISYARRYESWVQALHDNLERCLEHAGYKPQLFLDTIDLRAGRSWLSQLQTGLARAERLLLIVTPEAMASPWVDAEWQTFVTSHPDWADGRVLVVRLIDSPLPPLLETLQHVVGFESYDKQGYLQELGKLVAALLGQSQPVSLPSGLDIPPPLDPGLPAALCKELVAWLAPLLDDYMYRIAVAVQLGLQVNALDRYPTNQAAASAALVLATADDEPLVAARRVIDVLIEVVGRTDPDRVEPLRPLREAIDRLREAGSEGGLLRSWLARVERDHGTLVSYFQVRAGFDLLDPVYVQLELRPELAAARLGNQPELRLEQRPLDIREVLALTPERYPWVTRRRVIRGDPGAGKTTLLRHLAANLAQESDAHIPVFESLPRLMRQREWLLDRIEREMLRAGHQARGLATVLERSGQEGRLLLLLDGLDEVTREDRTMPRPCFATWPSAGPGPRSWSPPGRSATGGRATSLSSWSCCPWTAAAAASSWPAGSVASPVSRTSSEPSRS
jgi:hypothetical protein